MGLVFGVSLAVAATGRAAVVFVDAAATGAGDGSSWRDAFPTLGAALEAAREGDEVWVARGVYVPTIPMPPASAREATFLIRNSVTLYGGFRGVEASRFERDWVAHPTILSGDLARDDVPDSPTFENTGENAYHVVCVFEGAPTLDGFTITGGRADGVSLGATPLSHDQGSGANVYFASPSFRNCVFRRNWASNHGTINDHGDSVVEACAFEGNHAVLLGAGLYMHHHSRTRATRCRFERNTTLGDGAALYSRSMHGARVEECVVVDNHANRGGGMYVAEMAAPEIVGCQFEGNTAILGGGGIYSDLSFAHVMSCTFRANHAGETIPGGGAGEGGSGGGGIWTIGGRVIAEDCLFLDNVASFGGGFYAIEESAAEVRGCVFRRNRATEAGGLYTLGSPVVVSGCGFFDNDARGGVFSVGGGMSGYFSNHRVDGCVFVGNSAFLGGGGNYTEGESPVFTNCVFVGNRTTGHEQGWGGGVMNGYFTLASYANCAFVGNAADAGGGMYSMVFAEASVVNCTFVANAALVGAGGGIFGGEPGRTRVVNGILWGNVPDQAAGTTEAAYSCVQGGWAGAGNIAVEPQWVRGPSAGGDGRWGTADDDWGDLRLVAGSACIDAGDTTALSATIATDLGGMARRRDDPGTLDTGVGPAPVVDMGAYEFVPSIVCPADVDDGSGMGVPDGGVTVDDLLFFLAEYGAGSLRADVDDGSGMGVPDGGVTVDDLLYFVVRYEGGC